MLVTFVVAGHPGVTSAASSKSPSGVAPSTWCTCTAFPSDSSSASCVDWTRSTSNDLWETYNNLGVEACACVLFDQLKAVLSFDGTYVDDRHIMLIVDTMCRNGSIMALNRHPNQSQRLLPSHALLIRGNDRRPLRRRRIFRSARTPRVTTSIMTGQRARFGTGVTRILFPSEKRSASPKIWSPRASFGRRHADRTHAFGRG